MHIFCFYYEVLKHLPFLSRRVSRSHKADEVYRSVFEWLHKQVYGSLYLFYEQQRDLQSDWNDILILISDVLNEF